MGKPQAELPKRRRIAAAVVAVPTAVVVAGCGSADDIGPEVEASPQCAAQDNAATYADGTYEARPTQTTPEGTATINISATLMDGAVTDLAVDPEASNPMSIQYQQRFADAIREEVVGCPIESITAEGVAGASATSEAFTRGIAAIRAEASE